MISAGPAWLHPVIFLLIEIFSSGLASIIADLPQPQLPPDCFYCILTAQTAVSSFSPEFLSSQARYLELLPETSYPIIRWSILVTHSIIGVFTEVLVTPRDPEKQSVFCWQALHISPTLTGPELWLSIFNIWTLYLELTYSRSTYIRLHHADSQTLIYFYIQFYLYWKS